MSEAHDRKQSPGDFIQLRLGPWQTALADVETCDFLACDPPYSDRTHAGQRTGSSVRDPTIDYSHVTQDDAHALAQSWAPRVRFWVAMFGDHLAFRYHEQAWIDVGWYVFAPLPWMTDVPPPRLAGDGPACAAEYIMIARPKRRIPSERMGSRPGRYFVRGRYSCDAPAGIAGQKSLDGMRALIRDYTLPGDLVVDCFAGTGTTLIAAAIEGRRAIGAEMDPSTHAKALARIKRGYTPLLPGMVA